MQPPVVEQTLPEGAPAVRFVTGRLALEPTGTWLEFPPNTTEVFVGREDPVSNVFPEIDLTPYGGEAAGVSRRHARFTLEAGQLVIEDLDSTNFTFVNRKRVMPGARQVVRNGDELRFGRITARYEGI
jgi:pSer/pThr/pTyr-binding forkhead associated (FHA) protein